MALNSVKVLKVFEPVTISVCRGFDRDKGLVELLFMISFYVSLTSSFYSVVPLSPFFGSPTNGRKPEGII